MQIELGMTAAATWLGLVLSTCLEGLYQIDDKGDRDLEMRCCRMQ